MRAPGARPGSRVRPWSSTWDLPDIRRCWSGEAGAVLRIRAAGLDPFVEEVEGGSGGPLHDCR